MVSYKLYYINACPGARAVRLYMKYKNIEVEEVLIDMSKGEHKTDEFIKLNPMHTVPTLKINHECGTEEGLYESRVILKYLDKNTDINVDKWLFWDLGFLNPNVGKIIYPRIFRNEEPNIKDLPNLVEKIVHLDKELSKKKYLLGDNLSIADLSSCMLVENSQYCRDLLDIKDYQNVERWVTDIKNEVGEDKWNYVMTDFYKWRDKL